MKNFKYIFVAVIGALATCALCAGTVVLFQSNNPTQGAEAIEVADEEYYIDDEYNDGEDYYDGDDYDYGEEDITILDLDEVTEGYETEDVYEEE